MVRDLVVSTLTGLGIDVIDLGLSTTPTVEMAVKMEKADGGIILTASHNPKEWNALKLLNSEGEFISAELGEKYWSWQQKKILFLQRLINWESVTIDDSYLQKHIDAVLTYPLVNAECHCQKEFKSSGDAVNSTGAILFLLCLKHWE